MKHSLKCFPLAQLPHCPRIPFPSPSLLLVFFFFISNVIRIYTALRHEEGMGFYLFHLAIQPPLVIFPYRFISSCIKFLYKIRYVSGVSIMLCFYVKTTCSITEPTEQAPVLPLFLTCPDYFCHWLLR